MIRMTRWESVKMLRKCSILNPNLERQRVMKKIYMAMAVIAAAMLSSCEKEKDFNELTPLGENDIAFTMQNASTRSADASMAVKGISIPMGTAGGDAFVLEETIEEMNPIPATKGTPAYTVNLGTLYKTMGVYAGGNFGDEGFEVMDTVMFANPNGGQGWRYHHNYDGSPWPSDETEVVDFYLRMPASQTGVSDLNYANKKTSFTFTSPATASAQQDILFSQTSISKKQHDEYLPKGAPVMMYHALTGVKFRTGHENNTATKTIITKVRFLNLNDKGDCTVDLAANDKIKWDNVEMVLGTFSQDFKNEDYSAEAGVDGTVTYSASDKQFGDSWYAAAADKNLNDEKGSLTFWFIPQEITDDVKLEVTFRVKTGDTQDGQEITHEIDFGKLLNEDRDSNVEWKAGQLRTYTLKPLDVDVDIFDEMNQYVKSGLHVTNTGNVDEYVRMLVIGNWYGWESAESKEAGDEPSILVGYISDGTDGDNTMVKPWDRWSEDYGDFDESFAGGELKEGRTDWVRASGGYYYTVKIGPGEPLPNSSPLFKNYTLDANEIPTIYVVSNKSSKRVPAVGVHLVMEVVVQAIGVPKKDDGTDVWWKQAWYDATGIDKLKPTDEEVAAH